MTRRLAALALAVALLCPWALAGETGIQTVEVVGVPLNFPVYTVYDQAGYATNYVKLRDVAWALQFTSRRFSVGFDGSTVIATGEAYHPVGDEMTPFPAGGMNTRQCTAALSVDGENVLREAYLLTPKGSEDGYFYYKLRDLGEVLGFTVGWSQDRGVYLDTP